MKKRQRYEVQTAFTYGWENCWTQGGRKLTFPTRAAARKDLDGLLRDTRAANMGMKRSDYRIRPVAGKGRA